MINNEYYPGGMNMDLVKPSNIIRKEKDFDALLQSADKVVALFYAMWCPFCVRFLPLFENAVQKSSEELAFIMVEDRETLEERYGINVVPTVLFFENGQLAKRLDGKLGVGLTEKQLTDFLKSV